MKAKAYKGFAFQVLFFTVLFAGIIVAINVIIEPYGLFRTDFRKQKIEPNQNFIKMKYILSHPDKYDSFVFGSSRVGKIDVTKIKGGRYYNMTYSEGLPREHLNNIQIMLKHGVKMKNLWIGLDDFSYKVDPAVHFEQTMRHPYTENKWPYYFKYLFKFPDPTNLKIYLSEEQPEFFTYYDIFNTGRPIIEGLDEWIQTHQSEHVKDSKFTVPTHYEGYRIEETVQDMKEIARIAKKHGIRLTVFINPIHITTYMDANPEQFSEFKKKLMRVTNFYDFSGVNSITTDNLNYYETSHYRVDVGDLMIYTISEKIPSVPGFGTYVTSDNIDRHIADLRDGLIDYIVKKQQEQSEGE